MTKSTFVGAKAVREETRLGILEKIYLGTPWLEGVLTKPWQPTSGVFLQQRNTTSAGSVTTLSNPNTETAENSTELTGKVITTTQTPFYTVHKATRYDIGKNSDYEVGLAQSELEALNEVHTDINNTFNTLLAMATNSTADRDPVSITGLESEHAILQDLGVPGDMFLIGRPSKVKALQAELRTSNYAGTVMQDGVLRRGLEGTIDGVELFKTPTLAAGKVAFLLSNRAIQPFYKPQPLGDENGTVEAQLQNMFNVYVEYNQNGGKWELVIDYMIYAIWDQTSWAREFVNV